MSEPAGAGAARPEGCPGAGDAAGLATAAGALVASGADAVAVAAGALAGSVADAAGAGFEAAGGAGARDAHATIATRQSPAAAPIAIAALLPLEARGSATPGVSIVRSPTSTAGAFAGVCGAYGAGGAAEAWPPRAFRSPAVTFVSTVGASPEARPLCEGSPLNASRLLPRCARRSKGRALRPRANRTTKGWTTSVRVS
jgi:hypothetical protein